jgi:hypothetical protein
MGSETAKAGKLDKGVMKVLMAVGRRLVLGGSFDLVSFLLGV